MDNKDLLNRYTALAMELQEEYLKKPQDFVKQEELQLQFSSLKREILKRMEGNE
jgi:hypothetical protein